MKGRHFPVPSRHKGVVVCWAGDESPSMPIRLIRRLRQ